MNKLLYFDPKQKKGYELSQGDSLFTKYFPKYQRQFSLTKNNGAIKSKIKRVKILKDFQHVGLHQNRSGWRVLLANKMKTIKALDSHANYAKEFAEKVKSFINLKSIRIFMPDFSTDFPELVEQRVKAVRKIFENMRSLKNLKHLEVTPISKDTNNYFSKLNSSPRLLSSLKMFKVGFDWRRTQNLDPEVSEQIEGNKNLLKSVNSLSLGPLERPCHFKILQRLSRVICPQITELFFEMSCRTYLKSPMQSRYSAQREKVNINYLENLSAFQNLKNLHIDIADTFTFLRDIVLPNSVQSLRFEFIENLTEQILLKIDHNFADSKSEFPTFFEENHFLLRFYENFRGLGHLENLHIAFSLESHAEAYKYQSYLLQSWLKRVPASLKHLKLLANKNSLGFNGVYVSEVLDFYLPEILESCENFAPTLKTLELGSSKVVYKRLDLSTFQNKFASLSSLKVSGRFIQDEDSDIDTLGLFFKQVVSIGDSLTHIELVISMNMRTKSLLSLLRRMRQVQELKKLEIELKVFFIPEADLDPSDFGDGINELRNNQEYDRKVESTLVEFHAIPDDGLFMDFLILFCEKVESKTVKR